MNLSVEQRIREFERTGDFSIILDLDKTPFEEYDDELIEGKMFMQVNAGHRPEGLSCYQFGMAWILDNFHPGIVSYFDSVASAENVEGSRFYDRILDSMLRKLDGASLTYDQLIRSNESRDIFSTVDVLERMLKKYGYFMALGNFHGEVYSRENGFVTLVVEDFEQQKKLWRFGEVDEWYREHCDERYFISNTNILEQQVQNGCVDVRNLRTKIFSRKQLEETFLEVEDLRKIV